MEKIKESEMVLASDGSLYHIHARGENLADDIFLVGDPERVNMFKDIFDSIEFESQNREIHVLTGCYHNHRFTALSTGMGTDNIDIVVTELDAAANMDLEKRCPLPNHRTLNLIRIGTSGSLHKEVKVGSLVAAKYAVGLDGLLNYYEHDDNQLEKEMTEAFVNHMNFSERLARPYATKGSEELLKKIGEGMHCGITATAPGFYAPQGRHVRIAPAIKDLNQKLATFSWDGLKVINLEMETSAIYGLSQIMGHNALSVCLIIANRADGTFMNEYHKEMRANIEMIMNRLS